MVGSTKAARGDVVDGQDSIPPPANVATVLLTRENFFANRGGQRCKVGHEPPSPPHRTDSVCVVLARARRARCCRTFFSRWNSLSSASAVASTSGFLPRGIRTAWPQAFSELQAHTALPLVQVMK